MLCSVMAILACEDHVEMAQLAMRAHRSYLKIPARRQRAREATTYVGASLRSLYFDIYRVCGIRRGMVSSSVFTTTSAVMSTEYIQLDSTIYYAHALIATGNRVSLVFDRAPSHQSEMSPTKQQKCPQRIHESKIGKCLDGPPQSP
jgi:hypothetical protein